MVERNEQGDAVRVIGTHTDLSALKQREAALDLHAGVFMNNLEGIVICGPDQRIESVNRTFTDITGYTAEEAIGRSPRFSVQVAMTPTFTGRCGADRTNRALAGGNLEPTQRW